MDGKYKIIFFVRFMGKRLKTYSLKIIFILCGKKSIKQITGSSGQHIFISNIKYSLLLLH